MVGAALRNRGQTPADAPARPRLGRPLFDQAHGVARPLDLAPIGSRLQRLGPPPVVTPALAASLEPSRPTELAEPPPSLADDGGDARLRLEPEDDPGGFLELPEGAFDDGPSAFGRLAQKIVGNTSPGALSRTKKMQAARLFLLAGQFDDAWRLLSTEQPRTLGSQTTLEAVMAAVASDHPADGLAWLGDVPPDGSARAAYWWARLAQRAGRDDLSRTVFENLSTREPFSYYGILGAARLHDGRHLSNPVLLDGRATRDTSDVPPKSVALVELAGLVRRHAALSQLARALELAQADSLVAAAAELRLAYRYRGGSFDRADELALARIARVLGDEELALRIAPPVGTRQFHRQAWRDLVIAAGARHQIDPDLVWSVMLRESYFHPNASSPAGATGLMQLMPETARAIARELGVQGFKTADLLDPDCSIDFGAFLLSALLRRYDGSVPVALAAYNAGIEPVDSWVAQQRGAEADIFCELIPYPETHRYVRRVLSSLALYQSAL